MLTVSLIVSLKVIHLFSLADLKIYALVCIEFLSSLKMWKSLLVSSDFVADVVRALPVFVRLTRAAYISLMDFSGTLL